MAVKVASVRASSTSLVIELKRPSTWLSRDGNHAMRILLKRIGNNCCRGNDRHSCWFYCDGRMLDTINTTVKLQAELDKLDNRSMAPSFFDVKVFAIRPSDGRRMVVRDIVQVNAARAAGCHIEIDLRLATNFPLTMRDKDALKGNLCHEMYRVEDCVLHTAIVHYMHARPGNPWQIIDDMLAHIEQTLI